MNPAQERILVRGVNWLGDAVMTTPALLRLREAQSHARISLLTPAKLAALWLHHPAVDDVLTFEKSEGAFTIARRLREEHFDTALVLPNSPRSALEPFLARIPRRIGYRRAWRALFLTDRVAPRTGVFRMQKRTAGEIGRLVANPSLARQGTIPDSSHHMHEYLHLAARLGARVEPLAPRVVVTEQEVAMVRGQFVGTSETGKRSPLFGLNPGAEYGPAKRWLRERFVATAVELQRRTGCRWWVFGGPADRDLCEAIAGDIQTAQAGPSGSVRSLAGQTSLRELCAALKACDVLLTNDTGPMHVAAAVGTPLVALFGSTCPELTGPGLPGNSRQILLRSDVPCSPCFLRECPIDFRCMNGISVSAVVKAVELVSGACGAP